MYSKFIAQLNIPEIILTHNTNVFVKHGDFDIYYNFEND